MANVEKTDIANAKVVISERSANLIHPKEEIKETRQKTNTTRSRMPMLTLHQFPV